MAEAIYNHEAQKRGLTVRAQSAGTEPSEGVNAQAMAALDEIEVSSFGLKPKLLTPVLAAEAEKIITMGCGVDASCPALAYVTEDWGLDDPHGQGLDAIRPIRDEIVRRVSALLDQEAKV